MVKKENNETWTYIRIKKVTVQKLKLLKLQLDVLMYEDVLQQLLTNYHLKKEANKK